MFFSRDEPAVHRHRFVSDPDEWLRFDWENDRESLLAEYALLCAWPSTDSLRGEGSTSYFPSRNAPGRIRQLNPEAKLLALLRNPVDRAYSAYWHYLAQGESCQSFEQHLRYESGMTLAMGEYRRHLLHWLRFFRREQLHIVILEDFVQDPPSRFEASLRFLGVDPGFLPGVKVNTNPARIPGRVPLQAWVNYLRQRSGSDGFGWRERVWSAVSRRNLRAGSYPPMRESTRRLLTRHYRRVNEGLSDIVGIDVDALWYSEHEL